MKKLLIWPWIWLQLEFPLHVEKPRQIRGFWSFFFHFISWKKVFFILLFYDLPLIKQHGKQLTSTLLSNIYIFSHETDKDVPRIWTFLHGHTIGISVHNSLSSNNLQVYHCFFFDEIALIFNLIILPLSISCKEIETEAETEAEVRSGGEGEGAGMGKEEGTEAKVQGQRWGLEREHRCGGKEAEVWRRSHYLVEEEGRVQAQKQVWCKRCRRGG